MIHRVYSSLPTFKTLTFRPGLNVILAQKSPGATSLQTRNRAGKTSLIEILHFLTGATAGRESLFRTPALLNHTFGMEFDLAGAKVTVERSGSQKSKLSVSGAPLFTGNVQIPNGEWLTVLGEKMFGLSRGDENDSRAPTFRSLFAYFVRRQLSNAFTAPEKQAVMQQLGDLQMALLFLIGLDWQVARDWQIVREREKTLDELKKAAGDGAFGSIIGKAADLRTELTVAEARLQELKNRVAVFKVLPEYHELESEASKLTRELNSLANANTIDLAMIDDLQKALASEAPPSLVDLQKVFEEVGVVLPGSVKRRYEEVRDFHVSVVRNRQDYLSGELEAANGRIQVRDAQKAGLDERRAVVMSILKSHGAFDQFSMLQGEVGRLESRVESLRQRFESAEKLEGTTNELDIERNRLTLRLRRDFQEQRQRLSDAILAFEETSKDLYESAGSMVIEETANGPSFKFPMQGSRSKGIKNMQIFCFDMMLMRVCAKRQIGPGFLVHDSHLFDGVDGRQVIRALSVGARTAKDLGFQYIVALNEDDAFKEKEEEFDLNDFVLPVRLDDKREDGGLFGFRFD